MSHRSLKALAVDEFRAAVREAWEQTGLRGPALWSLLRKFRAGILYPAGHQPKHGLTVGKEKVDPYVYATLQRLDRAARTQPILQALNTTLSNARTSRVEKRRQLAVFDRAELRAMAAKQWRSDIRLTRHAVATIIHNESAKRRTSASAYFPSIATIEEAIKGVKAIIRLEKARASSQASR